MFGLTLLLTLAATCVAQEARQSQPIDPDAVLARAELASAHNIFDPVVEENMAGLIRELRAKIIDFDGLSEVEENALLERFDAEMPKLIRDFQDELASRAVDELTYIEFLYPATVDADRWARITSEVPDRMITLAARRFSSIVTEGCAVQPIPSAGCRRLQQNLVQALEERGLD